jgi:hypothetical protein
VGSGVPNLLFHDPRRSALSKMIRAGVPEKIAMQTSGHKTASMPALQHHRRSRNLKTRKAREP